MHKPALKIPLKVWLAAFACASLTFFRWSKWWEWCGNLRLLWRAFLQTCRFEVQSCSIQNFPGLVCCRNGFDFWAKPSMWQVVSAEYAHIATFQFLLWCLGCQWATFSNVCSLGGHITTLDIQQISESSQSSYQSKIGSSRTPLIRWIPCFSVACISCLDQGTEAESLQFGLLQLSRHRRAAQRKDVWFFLVGPAWKFGCRSFGD